MSSKSLLLVMYVTKKFVYLTNEVFEQESVTNQQQNVRQFLSKHVVILSEVFEQEIVTNQQQNVRQFLTSKYVVTYLPTFDLGPNVIYIAKSFANKLPRSNALLKKPPSHAKMMTRNLHLTAISNEGK